MPRLRMKGISVMEGMGGTSCTVSKNKPTNSPDGQVHGKLLGNRHLYLCQLRLNRASPSFAMHRPHIVVGPHWLGLALPTHKLPDPIRTACPSLPAIAARTRLHISAPAQTLFNVANKKHGLIAGIHAPVLGECAQSVCEAERGGLW